MRYQVLVLALLFALSAVAEGPTARPIENTDGCQFIDIIDVSAFKEKGIGSGWIMGVTQAGGNAFKVVHVYREQTRYGDQMSAVVEVFRCD